MLKSTPDISPLARDILMKSCPRSREEDGRVGKMSSIRLVVGTPYVSSPPSKYQPIKKILTLFILSSLIIYLKQPVPSFSFSFSLIRLPADAENRQRHDKTPSTSLCPQKRGGLKY